MGRVRVGHEATGGNGYTHTGRRLSSSCIVLKMAESRYSELRIWSSSFNVFLLSSCIRVRCTRNMSL